MAWKPPAVETSADVIVGRILGDLADRLGVELVEGSPEVVLGEEVGEETALIAQAFAATTLHWLAGLGQTVYQLPAHEATPAAATVRIAVAAAGVIPAGFVVIGTAATGQDIAFTLADETPATPPHVDVTMTALGAAANAVPAGEVKVATATAIATGATLQAPPTGGADAETVEAYVARLVDWIGRLRPGGVVGTDLAVLAQSVTGVHRALGIDLHDPDYPGIATERSVTIVAIDETGAPVAGPIADEVKAVLEAVREVNFQVFTAAPTYTPLEVDVTATAAEGADPGVVEAAIAAALTDYLSPAAWGSTPNDATAWTGEATVRYLELVRVASSVPGLGHLDALTLDGGTTDVTLAGVAPLPQTTTDPTDPTTITVDVS